MQMSLAQSKLYIPSQSKSSSSLRRQKKSLYFVKMTLDRLWRNSEDGTTSLQTETYLTSVVLGGASALSVDTPVVLGGASALQPFS